MFENKMNSKDIHVLKKSPNPDSLLGGQVPGKREYETVFWNTIGKGQTRMAGDVGTATVVTLWPWVNINILTCYWLKWNIIM